MFGFWIVFGWFGSGKTQNVTSFLKWHDPRVEVNITNYYTGYSHFQISSGADLVNVLWDIYDYHQYVNLLADIKKIYRLKQQEIFVYIRGLRDFLNSSGLHWMASHVTRYADFFGMDSPHPRPLDAFRNFDKLAAFLEVAGLYTVYKKNVKFNIVLDEASVYFNPRDFAVNFSGKNKELLHFIYQPRKLNLLFIPVVQSVMELDVRFRRLTLSYREYSRGLHFIRWHTDYEFVDPENIDFTNPTICRKVGWGINLNFYPLFPKYDYNTKELIRPGADVYRPRSLLTQIRAMTAGKIPRPSLFTRTLRWYVR